MSFILICFLFFPGSAPEYVGQSNTHLLSALHGSPGFECVTYSSVVDNNSKARKKTYKISYDVPDMGWFKDPPANDLYDVPWQKEKDTFGLWKKTTKRPTTDRNFCPSLDSANEPKESFLTGPPAVCAESKLIPLLESKPLVRSLPGGKRVLELPNAVFEGKCQVSFQETPLFAIAEHQSKLSLGNTAAMTQVCSGIQDYMSWIVDNWDNKLDLSTYPGSASPGNRVLVEPSAHAVTISQQISAGLITGSTWLIDSFSHVRDAKKLVSNGLHSSMEYNAATMVASKHLGHSVVLSHCTERNSADWKSQLLDSKYNDPYLFGFLPSSSHAIFYNDKSKGSVSLLSGDIPPQVSAKEVKNKIFQKALATLKASSAAGGQAAFSGKRSRGGRPFRAAGGGYFAAKSQAQGAKASTQHPPKAKNTKKRKGNSK